MLFEKTTTTELPIGQSANRVDSDFVEVVSFSDFKNSLGLAANKYSDEEIEKMRFFCDKIADIYFDIWTKKDKCGLI